MLITIVFWLGCDRPSGLFFVRALLLSLLTPIFLPSPSVSLSFFVLAVPMRGCLGKYSCTSSPISNSHTEWSFSFLSLMQEKLNMPRGHYYRLCSWSVRSNHLIQKTTLGENTKNHAKYCWSTEDFKKILRNNLLKFTSLFLKTFCSFSCKSNFNKIPPSLPLFYRMLFQTITSLVDI